MHRLLGRLLRAPRIPLPTVGAPVLDPAQLAWVHLLIPPMQGIHPGARISGADPLRWPRPRRETAGPGGRICPAPRHADGPRPSAHEESNDAPARPPCGG